MEQCKKRLISFSRNLNQVNFKSISVKSSPLTRSGRKFSGLTAGRLSTIDSTQDDRIGQKGSGEANTFMQRIKFKSPLNALVYLALRNVAHF